MELGGDFSKLFLLRVVISAFCNFFSHKNIVGPLYLGVNVLDFYCNNDICTVNGKLRGNLPRQFWSSLNDKCLYTPHTYILLKTL